MKEQPNFHDIASERQVVRKSLREATENKLPEKIVSNLADQRQELDKAAEAFQIPLHQPDTDPKRKKRPRRSG